MLSLSYMASFCFVFFLHYSFCRLKKTFKFIIIVSNKCLWDWMHACHRLQVRIRGQLWELVSSFLPLWVPWIKFGEVIRLVARAFTNGDISQVHFMVLKPWYLWVITQLYHYCIPDVSWNSSQTLFHLNSVRQVYWVQCGCFQNNSS